MEKYPVALRDEITTGKAQIISCVDGQESKRYDIEIVKINNNLQETKNMVIKITDEELLDRNGGIAVSSTHLFALLCPNTLDL